MIKEEETHQLAIQQVQPKKPFALVDHTESDTETSAAVYEEIQPNHRAAYHKYPQCNH